MQVTTYIDSPFLLKIHLIEVFSLDIPAILQGALHENHIVNKITELSDN